MEPDAAADVEPMREPSDLVRLRAYLEEHFPVAERGLICAPIQARAKQPDVLVQLPLSNSPPIPPDEVDSVASLCSNLVLRLEHLFGLGFSRAPSILRGQSYE
ncbi:hypothetical protein H257_16573 [Aphanomyces astaci]|uniref:Uncharacterized protein n=1 Tax=Aphanomyces astaci TaxID=112090 RepID=W4FKD6_APHAT|nr:hypothetical protein H257_16573 [Aphanomyces astaci]ETV67178.1 hypothetical protein H257_16573 [Aphanomyces astaci]|eukprot:XP_009843343.1 hypothetical protein H257_16573 [Aphanomyces astaci]